uniref:Myosin XVA n=1 Tax=Rhinopithecus bieti TaxID=61621 RepID=A0A2K6K0T3_RHIBE
MPFAWSILRGQELPESWNLSQFNPRRLLAHSSAVTTCDVAPVCPCRDSCQRGWRLLYIVTAYHSCSEVLHPHLTRFLQDVSRTPGLPFQGIAKACEQNLQKTLRFGGRLELPSSIELRAMLAGRSSKRQLFLLPGGLERHLKIKTCTVALDVVEEICAEMALTRPEAFNEYVIFVVTNRGECQEE